MAIIVKDMDMPSECYNCDFAKNIRTNDYGSFCECSFDDENISINLQNTRKPSFCPLKPIEGLIGELEIYAGNQCDSWDNGVVKGAINVIKEYCGIGRK